MTTITFPVAVGDKVWPSYTGPWTVTGLLHTRDGQFMMVERADEVMIRDCDLIGVAVFLTKQEAEEHKND